jgi:hypothetical protein
MGNRTSLRAVHDCGPPLTHPPAPPIGPSMSDHSATRDNSASRSRVARPATAARATLAGPRFVQKSLYPCQPNLIRDFLRLRRLRRLRLRKILKSLETKNHQHVKSEFRTARSRRSFENMTRGHVEKPSHRSTH